MTWDDDIGKYISVVFEFRLYKPIRKHIFNPFADI